jgi:hypothetical protein
MQAFFGLLAERDAHLDGPSFARLASETGVPEAAIRAEHGAMERHILAVWSAFCSNLEDLVEETSDALRGEASLASRQTRRQAFEREAKARFEQEVRAPLDAYFHAPEDLLRDRLQHK